MRNKIFFRFILTCISLHIITFANAQQDRWQQHIKYNIDVKLDVNTNLLNGTEQIVYTNNSPDTLRRVFFHAYWNAFQPNSSMDVRSRELGKTILGQDKEGKDVRDWDKRVTDRISKLKPHEIGYQRISSIKMGGRNQKIKEHETIIEILLDKPILPKSKTTFDVVFEAQIPQQIRRAGRDNAEGIRYSMSQWYPKMAEYDYQGWNANPYIAREFYGVWGDFDVKITLDKKYMVASSGSLQNAASVGFGYEPHGTKVTQPAGNTLTWHFIAPNVHDFAWAADPTYKKITRQVPNGPLVHVVYKAVDSMENRWQKLADTVVMAYPIMAKTFGPYTHKNYSFIQAGDGGMEYPMATFLKNASIGTAIHEWMHSWYQMMLGTNESLYPWMDEGFTSYGESRVFKELRKSNAFAYEDDYAGYFNLAKSGWEEPMSTHADHYSSNYGYGLASYAKGAVFMEQLGYIVGAKVRDQILLDYYKQWRNKHPNPNDFIRVAENASGMELDWYKEYWVNTTKVIDYAIDSLWEEGGKTKIRIRRVGEVPMPVDVQLTFKDGGKENHYIPLNLMYGEKPAEDTIKRITHLAWKWTHPTYVVETSRKLTDVTQLEIDPTMRLADIDRRNNMLKLKW
jgi:hypothetical protein